MFKLESTPLPLQYTSVRSNLVPLPYSACIWTHCQHACSLFWNLCVYSLRPICICLLSEATGAPLVSISLVCMCLSDANLSLLGSTSPPALASTVFFFFICFPGCSRLDNIHCMMTRSDFRERGMSMRPEACAASEDTPIFPPYPHSYDLRPTSNLLEFYDIHGSGTLYATPCCPPFHAPCYQLQPKRCSSRQ